MSYMEAKNSIGTYKMDDCVLLSNFDAATRLLNRFEFSKLSLRKKTDLFFIDYDLIPLLFAENYLSAMKKEVWMIRLGANWGFREDGPGGGVHRVRRHRLIEHKTELGMVAFTGPGLLLRYKSGLDRVPIDPLPQIPRVILWI